MLCGCGCVRVQGTRVHSTCACRGRRSPGQGPVTALGVGTVPPAALPAGAPSRRALLSGCPGLNRLLWLWGTVPTGSDGPSNQCWKSDVSVFGMRVQHMCTPSGPTQLSGSNAERAGNGDQATLGARCWGTTGFAGTSVGWRKLCPETATQA